MADSAAARPDLRPVSPEIMPLPIASLAVSPALATAAAASGGIGERLPYSVMAASAAARPVSRPASRIWSVDECELAFFPYVIGR